MQYSKQVLSQKLLRDVNHNCSSNTTYIFVYFEDVYLMYHFIIQLRVLVLVRRVALVKPEKAKAAENYIIQV